MLQKRINLLLLVLFAVVSCKQVTPRRPVSHTGKINMNESIQFNKNLLNFENEQFKQLMEVDSLQTYHQSNLGFWYAYLDQNEVDTYTPKTGDDVKLTYEVLSIEGDLIYSKEEIGVLDYLVDQQELIQGLQEGIKLMKKNEKVLFLLPSQKAYAFHGDEKKIGPNTPLIIKMELLSIKNH